MDVFATIIVKYKELVHSPVKKIRKEMYHIIILCLRNYNTNSILYMTRFKMVMIDNYIEIFYHIYCTILASGYIDTLDWAV